MEHITIKINASGAAFDPELENGPASEIARILRELADDFENGGIPPEYLRDVNGNRCGEVQIVSAEDEEG